MFGYKDLPLFSPQVLVMVALSFSKFTQLQICYMLKLKSKFSKIDLKLGNRMHLLY